MLAAVLVTLAVCPSARGQEEVIEPGSESSPGEHSVASEPVQTSSRAEPALLTAVQASPELVELTLSTPVQFRGDLIRGVSGDAGRFFVDISPASLIQRRSSTFELASGPIRRVRISLFRTDTVRVVLDLREKRDFQVTTLTDPYRLAITASEKEGTPSQAPPNVPTKEVAPAGRASERNSKKKKAQPAPEFPQVEWLTITHPWTFMLHSHPTMTTGALAQPTPVVVVAEAAEARRPDNMALEPFSVTDEPERQGRALALDLTPFPHYSLAPPFSWSSLVAAPPGEEVNNIQTEEIPPWENSSEQPAQETIHIGGSIMHELWLVAMTAGVFLAFLAGIGVVMLWNVRKRGATTEKSDGWETRMAYLEEAVNRAGMLNNSFFHGLEVSQKRIESLLTQADVTEQNLRRLLHQAALAGQRPTGHGADSLETATLLLEEGEEVQHVARTLKLPLAQVRLLQELKQYTQKENPAGAAEKFTATPARSQAVSAPDDLKPRLNRAARNGMHLADNRQSL